MTLLEREHHLAFMERALAESRAGAGGLVLVSGEAGIGKTTLVEHIAAQPAGRVPVWWGACDALFTPRPLGPLHDMAAQIGGELPALLAADAPRPRLFAAVLAALQRQPVVVVFEDVHWADEATLDLLRFLGRRAGRTPALLIVTYRDDQLGPRHPARGVLGDLATLPTTHRLALTPLSEQAVRALAGDRPVDAAALHRQTGGNPFYVSEMLASPGDDLPASVREAVLARAARLSLSGYAVLEAAAVIGQRCEVWLLAAVTAAEAQAAEECLAAGLLQAQGEALVFRHALVRAAILAELSPPRRQVLHRLVLEALRASPLTHNDFTRLVHHAEAASDPEAILAFAPRAAQAAVALGMHRAAMDLYGLALRYAGRLPVEQQLDLHEAHSLAAQVEPGRATSLSAYRRAAELARTADLPLREGWNLVRLAGTLDTLGQQSDEADAALARALALLEPHAPNRGLIDAYRVLASRHLAWGEPEAAVRHARRGYDLALQTEQVPAILSAGQILGLCLLPLDHAQGCAQLEQALGLALEHNLPWMAATLYPNLVMTYVDAYQLGRAEALLEAALPYTRERDLDPATHMLEAWQALLRLYQGQWAQGLALASALLERGEQLEGGSRNPALLAVGRVRARRGEPGAMDALDTALEQSARTGNRQRLGLFYCARAEAAWLAGDPDSARREARGFYATAVQNQQPGFAGVLANWLLRAGEPVQTAPWLLRPIALEIQGDWQGAAAAWEALGCPYERARALASGDAAAQTAALAVFEQMGARPAADELRARLRATGTAGLPRRPRASTRENPFGLTTRQVDVLRLLAQRLSNTEIAARLHLSPKTVDHHVSAILAKLDVETRQAAADLAEQNPFFSTRP